MKITAQWLRENGACHEGRAWFSAQKEANLIKVARKLVNQDHLDWANWVITRAMPPKQKVAYAVYAAKRALAFFEARYPDDVRPRNAIKAVERFLKTGETAGLCNAANAAYAAAYADAANAGRKMKTKVTVYGLNLLRGRQ